MQIDWWTLALQAINFLVLVWLLQRFLYKPVRAVISKRRQLADQAVAEADAAKAAAAAEQQGYQKDRAALADQRQELQKQMHAELEAEREKIVAAARAEADTITAEARSGVAEEREAALHDLHEQVADLAVDMASNLLTRLGSQSAGLNHGFLDQVEQELAKLPGDERARLHQDLTGPNAHLTVVTAVPLGEDDRARWQARLNDCLLPVDAIDFTVDPAIVGGAELRFPHAVLSFTWADLLAQARADVLAEGQQGGEEAGE